LCDIQEFVLKHWPEDLQLEPLNLKVAVHEPCSQRNVLKNTKTLYALLQKIPGLNVIPLPDNQTCCGAGGSYMLTHPDNAERLRAMKRQAIVEASAELVVSSNYGCAVFLKQPKLPVVHPILLLENQLKANC
jgi:glycolate oxidase iron-sulfur subunit